jgi:O-antigen/teichoic acid export membrane protein
MSNAAPPSAPPLPPERPSLIRSAATTYLANIAVALCSFLSVLITARVLGAEGRGSVAFLTTVAYLTAQLATVGVYQANANFAARNPELVRDLAGTTLVLAGGFGAVAAGIVGGLVAVFPAVGGGSDTGLIVLVLAVLPMLVLQPSLDQLLRSQYHFTLANTAWVSMLFSNVVLNAILALADALTIGTAVSAWIAGQLLGTAMMARGVMTRLDGFGGFDRALARRMLGFGIQAYAGRVMLLGNYRLDQWLLGGIAGPRELGLYSVAVAWVEALFFLPTALTMVQRPDLVRASPEDAERQASIVFRATLMITIVLALVLVALAPFLCVTLFGEEFRDSIGMLRVLSLGAFGIVALKLLGNALTAQRKPMLETAAIAVAFALIATLDVILIPEHGGWGAAIASSVAYSAGGAAVALIFTRALRGRLRDLIPRPGDLVYLWRRVRERMAPGRAA